jgi:hypothetical protein
MSDHGDILAEQARGSQSERQLGQNNAMADDATARPGLADRYANQINPFGAITKFDAEVLAALRAGEAEDWTREIEETLKARVVELERAIDAVRAIHKPEYPRTKSGKYVGGCLGCDCAYYPCKTIQAIDGLGAVQAPFGDTK